MSIGTKRAVHISFVVRDIDKVMENWAALLGVEKPEIIYIPGPDVAPTLTDGEPQLYHSCRLSTIQLDNLVLEVCQPGEEPSPWKTFLEKHGEGLMHVAFLSPDEKEAEDAIRSIGASGRHYHIGYYPEMSYAFYDTWDQLGIELNIKIKRDNAEIMNEIREKIAKEEKQ